MQFLPSIDYQNIDSGIEYLKTHKFNYYPPEDEEIIFHVYWYGSISRKQICCINSYLATQNLQRTKLWVWLDEDTYEQEKNKIPIHNNITVNKYSPIQEAKGTLFENKDFIQQKKFLKFRSDLARVIFLYKYGGLYYDLDMILLKDLLPILGLEFCYTWGHLLTGNNAILRIKKNSELSIQLMNKYLNILKKNFFNINFNNLIFTKEINIMCFPCVMFDPVWILFDKKQKSKYSKLCNFDNFFKSTDENINDFFNNQIFGYHWHSRNSTAIEKNSYFEKLENNQNKYLL